MRENTAAADENRDVVDVEFLTLILLIKVECFADAFQMAGCFYPVQKSDSAGVEVHFQMLLKRHLDGCPGDGLLYHYVA